jgi:UDP-N-acetylmuramate--alanine ligase
MPMNQNFIPKARMDSHRSAILERPASRFVGKRVHFIGIGGSGMSGLARMLLDDGAIVSGSEPKPSNVTYELQSRGVKISRDQMGQGLDKQVDLVVRTAAVPDSNPEYLAARALGLATIKYAQLLGQVMAERHGIAVAGTHGKSTTTAMIAYTLLQCGVDASFVVGGTVPQLGGGSRSGSAPAFVAEACEFDRSFHNLHPTVIVLTNVEEDHLDCYKDLDDIIASFQTFARLVPANGTLIVNGQDVNVARSIVNAKAAVETVALVETGAILTNFTWAVLPAALVDGRHQGDLYHRGKLVGRMKLSVAGEHNLINAAMAIAACANCGVDPAAAIEAIAGFTGVDRRMTEVGRFNGAIVIDDYGHHPTEIRATLAALRQRYRPNRLFCVFQPHQHSRTRFLLNDFATAFTAADETILADIYFVRDSEAERQSVNSGDLVARIVKNGQKASHLATFEEITSHLRTTLGEGDLVVTMGAGNIWEVGRDLIASH